MTEESRKKIIDILNIDRAHELANIIQYMGHHYEARGLESMSVKGFFKESAINEMTHAERLAERVSALGGIPVQKPTPVKRGGTLEEMLRDDLAVERAAIERYREHIRICAEEGDTTTRRLLEELLEDEEGHADTIEQLLGE